MRKNLDNTLFPANKKNNRVIYNKEVILGGMI